MAKPILTLTPVAAPSTINLDAISGGLGEGSFGARFQKGDWRWNKNTFDQRVREWSGNQLGHALFNDDGGAVPTGATSSFKTMFLVGKSEGTSAVSYAVLVGQNNSGARWPNIPCDQNKRRLHVYGNVQQGTWRLRASMSDSSAPAVERTIVAAGTNLEFSSILEFRSMHGPKAPGSLSLELRKMASTGSTGTFRIQALALEPVVPPKPPRGALKLFLWLQLSAGGR